MKANRGIRIGILSIVSAMLALGAAPAAALTLCGVEEIRWTAHGQNFDPSQTYAPGGPSRPVSTDRVEVRWWPTMGQAELRWELDTHHPLRARYDYLEQLAPDGGVLSGRDGFRGDEGAMAPARVAARFSDLWLRVPLLWRGEDGGHSREISVGGTRWTLSVVRDSIMGGSSVPLVAQARVLAPPQGVVDQQLAYADWRDVEGLSMPGRIELRLDGRLLRRERIEDVAVRPAEEMPADCEEPPLRPESAEAPAWARGMTHWVTRRLAMGAGAEADQTRNVELEPLGDSVFHVVGGTHHALLVVGDEALSLVGAPLHPARSETLLRKLAERWPERPLKHVVVTHHHDDHSAGLRPLLGEDSTLYVGHEAVAFFEAALADIADHGFTVRGVRSRERAKADGRSLNLINIPNDHAAGMLAVRVDDVGLTFVSDLYSPGRDNQNSLLARQLLRALEWHDLASGRLVGAHGSGSEPVAALVEWLAAESRDPTE